jgi:hypothetical protein
MARRLCRNHRGLALSTAGLVGPIIELPARARLNRVGLPGAAKSVSFLFAVARREAGRQQALAFVSSAIEQMDEDLRDVFLLCDVEESSIEAAEAVGIPVGTVKSRLRRARESATNARRNARSDEPRARVRSAPGAVSRRAPTAERRPPRPRAMFSLLARAPIA